MQNPVETFFFRFWVFVIDMVQYSEHGVRVGFIICALELHGYFENDLPINMRFSHRTTVVIKTLLESLLESCSLLFIIILNLTAWRIPSSYVYYIGLLSFCGCLQIGIFNFNLNR